jgi:transketolase
MPRVFIDFAGDALMRNAFAQQLAFLAENNPDLVFLSGDIGNRLFNKYKELYPKRFINCGVAEANMTSMAAGLALEGLKPITYTIAAFNTVRCLEQIRNDICYHKLPVIIVGVGAGLSYASLGGSHHCLEDISFLRALPNMQVLCPSDPVEVKLLLTKALASKKPTYLRLGKKGEPIIHQQDPNLTIGKAHLVKPGNKHLLITTGTMLSTALTIAGSDPQFAVASFHTIKPLDIEFLTEACDKYQSWVSIEEHSLIGGLGSAIAEWLITQKKKPPYLRCGTPDVFAPSIGSKAYLLQQYELTEDALRKKISAFHKENV